ncbi:MAG: DUF1801 domain-containing protein [Agriterribacter sp.]
MLTPIDNWFNEQEEPAKSCLLFLREFIPQQDARITEEWKYKLPFYYLNGKMMCYLWIHKKYQQPYIGIVRGSEVLHKDLLQEKRARMKILLIDPDKDIPVKKIRTILKDVIGLYK